MNLYSKDSKITASDLGLITSSNQKYCYLLSERGYTKLVAMMDNTNEKRKGEYDLIDIKGSSQEPLNLGLTPREIANYKNILATSRSMQEQ